MWAQIRPRGRKTVNFYLPATTESAINPTLTADVLGLLTWEDPITTHVRRSRIPGQDAALYEWPGARWVDLAIFLPRLLDLRALQVLSFEGYLCLN